MNGFDGKHIFLRELVKIWQNAVFNLNGIKHTFQKRNILYVSI